MKSKVTRKFQITIPKEIRERLGIKVGDIIHWEVKESGEIILRKIDKVKDIEDFRGRWSSHPLVKKFGNSVRAIKWLRGHAIND